MKYTIYNNFNLKRASATNCYFIVFIYLRIISFVFVVYYNFIKYTYKIDLVHLYLYKMHTIARNRNFNYCLLYVNEIEFCTLDCKIK